MPNYKPHAPAIVGCEWPGARQRVLPIGPGNAAGASFVAASSESVSAITTLTRTPAGTQPLIICDVYDLANDINPPDELCLAKPVDCYRLDANGASGFHTWIAGVHGGGSDPQVTQCVDDIVGDNDPTTTGAGDALVTQQTPLNNAFLMFHANGTFFHGTDGSSGASITGKRIKYVEVIAIMSNQSPTPMKVAGCVQGSSSLGTEHTAAQILPANAVYQRMRFRFPANDAIGGLPWDHGNIAPFLTGTAGFGVVVLSKPGAGWFTLSAVEFGVHVCAEARVATGHGFAAPGTDTYTAIPMADPTDLSAQNWSKQSGHEYLVAFTAIRAPSAIFGVSVAGVAGATLVDLPNTHLASVGLGAEGMAVPTSDLIPDIDAMQCLLTVGGGYSADSNAYATVETVVVGADGVGSARQDLTGSGNFGTVGILVAGDGTQNKPLTIQLKRGSSVLATATISPQDSDAPSDGRPTVIKRALDNAVSFSGGEYLQVSSTSTHGWSLPRLSTRTPATAGASQAAAAAVVGIGGSGDSGDSNSTRDYPWWAATIPNPPTGLTAASANYTTTNASPGGPKRISYAALNWTTTSLGGNFDHYEVLRNNNVIAAITDESKSYFNDFEARRGEVASYAVRVVRTDGAVSHVSAAATATITSPGDCDEILTCNADPTLTCAYQSAAPHGYGRISSNGITPVAIAGRQSVFVVRPLLEGNVDEFSRVYTVQINDFDVVPAVFDRAPFDPIVAIIEAPLPYVAVCEGNGRRWFAAGKIGQGSMVFDQPGNAHRATVAWTEVATLPAIVQTDDPWQP